jgi:hypothetical protein
MKRIIIKRIMNAKVIHPGGVEKKPMIPPTRDAPWTTVVAVPVALPPPPGILRGTGPFGIGIPPGLVNFCKLREEEGEDEDRCCDCD